jgi:hypothetical protein
VANSPAPAAGGQSAETFRAALGLRALAALPPLGSRFDDVLMETITGTGPDLATERLTGELADVQASISLVATGVATRITLTGLRFGRQVAERLGPSASSRGVDLETSFWPEDSVCDVHVQRSARVATRD